MRSDRRPVKDPQGVDGFTTLLRQAGVDFGVEDLADALWLAKFVDDPGVDEAIQADDPNKEQEGPTVREEYLEPEEDLDQDNTAQLSLPSTQAKSQGGEKPDGIPIKAPAAPALRIRLDLSRALRPLRRMVDSPGRLMFDEAATVEQIADQQIWSPVMKPAPERWLDVALVVEETQALSVWKETITEVQTLLERQGAFRQVTTWRLKEQGGKLALFQHWRRPGQRPRQAKDLWDPSGRRLILLLSDCTSVAWHDGSILTWLQTWSKRAPTAMMQLLPERLWSQTGLGGGVPVQLGAIEPGCVNERLMMTYRLPIYKQLLAGIDTADRVKLPVVTLQAQPLKQWAKVVAGSGESWATGMVFDGGEKKREEIVDKGQGIGKIEPALRVQRFRMTASLMAQELAGLMSVAPVSPPIVDLIRQTLLPRAEPVHVAEVYMGGLMEPSQANDQSEVTYDFDDEVRKLLANSVPRSVSKHVLNAVSAYISERLNLNTRSFEALLSVDFGDDVEAEGMVVPFARVAEQTLRRMGREYAAIADRIQTRPKVALPSVEGDASNWVPLLQTFTFREAMVVFETQSETTVERSLEVAEPDDVEDEIQRYGLTPREAEVWRLRRQGLTHQEIAQELVITANTVKKHVNNILSKQQLARVQSNDDNKRYSLTSREADVWQLRQRGATYQEIAQELFISVNTVKKHLKSILAKRQFVEKKEELAAESQRYGFTEREAAVWELHQFNHNKEEIAKELYITVDTVRKHLRNIQAKREQVESLGEDMRFERFSFETAYITLEKTDEQSPELLITYQESHGRQYIEGLGKDIELPMVLLSGGTFEMGSPEDEQGYDPMDGPQHVVRVPSFFIAKYPITQAQWCVIAAMPQVNRELEADPSHFKGDNCPVESVSWFDAVEFCARLSNHTGREYRLPTEAEWEYACRAGTTTPFHLGETITADLANYNATETFGSGPEGEYREQTTDVASFPANAFGLYDMHGNVWEWCLDHWHDNYEGAPTDGSARIDPSKSNKKDSDESKNRVLRGGSWYIYPEDCRSAARNSLTPGDRSSSNGFRVVCGSARTS